MSLSMKKIIVKLSKVIYKKIFPLYTQQNLIRLIEISKLLKVY